MTNRLWLTQSAGAPMRRNLGVLDKNAGELLENAEAKVWYERLAHRSDRGEIGSVHGSHDYRMENILGKCWILGFSKNHTGFDRNMGFILRFLEEHIKAEPPSDMSFAKIYHYRDYEKVLCCFLPFLGYKTEPAVARIVRKRIDILYGFTRTKRYDIYADGSLMKGVKKEWKTFMIDPDLYSDGNIALPDMHDYLLLAGSLPSLTAEETEKAENIAEWLFDERYKGIFRRYGYFYAPGGAYNAKAVIFKLRLLDFNEGEPDGDDLKPHLFNTFVLSHFKAARKSEWFNKSIDFLGRYKNGSGRYDFPPRLITEKPDGFVIFGGHMNAGEDRKSKLYGEILSTYWMERILDNMKPMVKKND